MTYPGGKGRLWQQIAALMPPHETYIETHLGGGAVLRNKLPARRSIGIDVDPSVVAEAKKWGLKNTEFFERDAIEFLSSYSFSGTEMVYCDPPYPLPSRGGRKYYRCEPQEAHHEELILRLRELPCPVIVSGYPGTQYHKQLSDWHLRKVKNSSQAGAKEECLWLNFEPAPLRHDYQCIGSDFRERERIRRRSKRWVRKLEGLTELERHVVVDAILASDKLLDTIQREFEKPGRSL